MTGAFDFKGRVDIVGSINENIFLFFSLQFRVCLQLCETAAGVFNGARVKKSAQLEAFGRVSRDFTYQIDTDEEKRNCSPLIRIAHNNHGFDKSRYLVHLSRHHVNVITKTLSRTATQLLKPNPGLNFFHDD